MDREVKVMRARGGSRHSNEFRAVVLAACKKPGARVSIVAKGHGINTNLVYKWLQKDRCAGSAIAASSPTRGFLPLQIESPVAAPIVVELSRRKVTVRLTWPAQDVEGISRLLRGVLL